MLNLSLRNGRERQTRKDNVIMNMSTTRAEKIKNQRQSLVQTKMCANTLDFLKYLKLYNAMA